MLVGIEATLEGAFLHIKVDISTVRLIAGFQFIDRRREDANKIEASIVLLLLGEQTADTCFDIHFMREVFRASDNCR